VIRRDLREILNKQFPEEEIVIDYVPRDKEGDYYTNLAFKVAAREGKKPIEVAERIASQIESPIIEKVSVHEPAFINFTLSEEYLKEQLSKAPALDLGGGRRVLIEFVSANPTGPINVVSARAAAVGDALIRLLRETGFTAHAEYYVNDAGRQTDLLAESVRERMKEIKGGRAQIPKDGYHVKDVAKEALEQGLADHDDIRNYSIEYFINDHRRVMGDFGVTFDVWSRESKIIEQRRVEEVLGTLEDKDLLYKKDGARYFKTTDYGDDKDRVIVTSDNRNTYLLPDIAYHLDKLERKYQLLIDIWGPDHHGRIRGILGGVQALGYPKDILKILIVQEVKLKQGGKLVSMSKRAGTFASLSGLLNEIPKDVVRFFFLMRSSTQHLEFDLDLARKQSDENPVYYVQYAHARIKSIIEHAAQNGVELSDQADLTLINKAEEITLVKDILKYEEVLEDAVRTLEPYVMTYYMIEVARDFHYFYQKHRVVSDDRELTRARLYLISKTAEIIRNGLELIGVSCPERM
jgi:arginyl-tRNA synthetase